MHSDSVVCRLAVPADAASIAAIYNEGIAGRDATFETRPRSSSDVLSWFDQLHPIVVATLHSRIVGFAATFPYRARDCYRGIAEFSVYVDSAYRRLGLGNALMQFLIRESARAGFWKLLSRVFPENVGSRRLLAQLGFREVGIYEKHGALDGQWKDVVIVERLIPEKLR